MIEILKETFNVNDNQAKMILGVLIATTFDDEEKQMFGLLLTFEAITDEIGMGSLQFLEDKTGSVDVS